MKKVSVFVISRGFSVINVIAHCPNGNNVSLLFPRDFDRHYEALLYVLRILAANHFYVGYYDDAGARWYDVTFLDCDTAKCEKYGLPFDLLQKIGVKLLKKGVKV